LAALSIAELEVGEVDGLVGSVLEDDVFVLGRDVRDSQVDDFDGVSYGLRVVDRVFGLSSGARTPRKTDEKYHDDNEDRPLHNRCIRGQRLSVPSETVVGVQLNLQHGLFGNGCLECISQRQWTGSIVKQNCLLAAR
jgi:hypothetical protein